MKKQQQQRERDTKVFTRLDRGISGSHQERRGAHLSALSHEIVTHDTGEETDELTIHAALQIRSSISYRMIS